YKYDIALKIIRMLMSLPLLPAMSMRLGFDELRLYSSRNNVNFESLFSYYERFLVYRMGTQFVSVYNCPRRTNNNIESFHNKLRLKFCSVHPNLWIFIEKLCDISKEYHVMIGQINNERRPTRSLSNQFLANGRQIRDATAENWVTNIENQNPQENDNVRDIDNNLLALDQNRVIEVDNI
ncbi:RING-type domain-containing protein, partial [Aphis craccivora]